MLSLFAVFTLSLLLCLILTPAARAAAARCGLVDRPDGRRKIHARPTPVAGGLAILASGAAALAAVAAWPDPLAGVLRQNASELLTLLAAALVICAVGVADDARGLRGRYKLAGQALAVAVLIGSGFVVRSVRLFDWQLDLGPLAIPFTALWLLGAINSLNLLDGMDGLLSTVGTIVSVTFGLLAVLGEHWAAAYVALALGGALIGFLRYNFPPASIFLGDSGSMLIGLVIGVLGIHSSLKAPATIALVTPMALLTIPFFDTLAAIVRRKLTGRSIYTTDRGHLHHCLLQHGFTSRRVLLCVSICCLATALGALASLAFSNDVFALLTALGVVAILVVSRLFGYAEFLLLKDRLLTGAAAHGKAHQVEVRLQGTGEWCALWDALVSLAGPLNLESLCLDVNAPALHEGYHARWEQLDCPTENGDGWQAQVPLRLDGQSVGRIEIVGRRDPEPVWRKLERVQELLGRFERQWAGEPAAPSAYPALTVPSARVLGLEHVSLN